jgi:glycogen operon protein
MFDRRGRKPWACVNFVTAHDGFTLNDVVTYNEKHNDANGEENNDGTTDNRSWNCGAEGPTEDAEVNALRARQMRNMLATLLLSQGTPMILAGDEFARTQQGNNNAYCQDTEISWVDWSLAEQHAAQIAFVRKLTALRSAYPILRRSRFLTGAYNEELGIKDVTWINATGAEMRDEDWEDGNMRCFGMLMDGRAQATGIRQRGGDATMLLVMNSHHDVVKFTLPECLGGEEWALLIDTNIPEATEEPGFKTGDIYDVTARSLLLYVMRAAPGWADPSLPATAPPLT